MSKENEIEELIADYYKIQSNSDEVKDFLLNNPIVGVKLMLDEAIEERKNAQFLNMKLERDIRNTKIRMRNEREKDKAKLDRLEFQTKYLLKDNKIKLDTQAKILKMLLMALPFLSPEEKYKVLEGQLDKSFTLEEKAELEEGYYIES